MTSTIFGIDILWILNGCLAGAVTITIFAMYGAVMRAKHDGLLSRFRLGQEIQNRFRQIENRREIVKY